MAFMDALQRLQYIIKRVSKTIIRSEDPERRCFLVKVVMIHSKKNVRGELL